MQMRHLRFWCAMVVVCVISVGCTNPAPDDSTPIPRPPDESVQPLSNYRSGWNSNGMLGPVVLDLAGISEEAYFDERDSTSRFETLGFQRIKAIEVGSMFAYVLSSDDVGVVAFRGTDDREDWKVNFRRKPNPLPEGQVHTGFYDAYHSIRSQIHEELGKVGPRYLWITGHSLGGALAVVCATDLNSSTEFNIAGVVTFGQPAVSKDRKLALHIDDFLTDKYARFVNESDAVPRMPPFYEHCGSLVWFKNGSVERVPQASPTVGSLKELSPFSDDEPDQMTEAEYKAFESSVMAKEAVDPFDGTVQGNIPFVKNHGMALYIEKIRNNFSASNSN